MNCKTQHVFPIQEKFIRIRIAEQCSLTIRLMKTTREAYRFMIYPENYYETISLNKAQTAYNFISRN